MAFSLRAFVLLVAFVLPLFLAGPAGADHGRQGVLHGVSYQDLPDQATIQVTLFDDSPENLEIKLRFEAALRQAGYRIVGDGAAGDGALELAVESAVSGGAIESEGPSLGRVQGSNEGGVDVQVNVWLSSKDSLLGGRKAASGGGARSELRLEAALRERATGQLFWQGSAVAILHLLDRARAAQAMVAPLVDGLGQTITERSFPID